MAANSPVSVIHPTDIYEVNAKAGVEVVRVLVQAVKFAPTASTHRLLIVRDAEFLSEGSLNALSRVLEAPPAHLRVLLVAQDITKVDARVRRFVEEG